MVGGDCNYQTTKGMVLIKSKTKDSCFAQFTPKQVDYDIEFICKDNVKVGKSYFAILKKAKHGACTPIMLSLPNEIE